MTAVVKRNLAERLVERRQRRSKNAGDARSKTATTHEEVDYTVDFDSSVAAVLVQEGGQTVTWTTMLKSFERLHDVTKRQSCVPATTLFSPMSDNDAKEKECQKTLSFPLKLPVTFILRIFSI